VLLRVAGEVQGGPLSAEYRNALEVSLNYFHAAAPRHTEDEEHSLFPRMRHLNDHDVKVAMRAIDELEVDHLKAAAQHEAIEEIGRRWLEFDGLSCNEAAKLLHLLRDLRETYA